MLRSNVDMVWVIALSALVLAATVLGIESVWVRSLLVLPLAIYGVGYAVGKALFPARSLGAPERFLLSLSLSISTLILIGLLLQLLPNGHTAGSWAALLFIITTAAGGLVVYRRLLEVHRSTLAVYTPAVPSLEKMRNGESIQSYLGSGLICGIGPKLAERIVHQFGSQSLDIIEHNPERLSQVPGIGPKRVEGLLRSCEEQKPVREFLLSLYHQGVSSDLISKLYRKYGLKTVEKLQANPYRIMDDIFGVSFASADQISRIIGLPRSHPVRLKALVANFRRWLLRVPSVLAGNVSRIGEDNWAQLSRTNLERVSPWRVVMYSLSAMLVTLSIGMALLPAPQDAYQGYTLFWMSPRVSGTSSQIELGVQSMEFNQQSYRIELYDGEELVQIWDNVLLSPKQEWSVLLDREDFRTGIGPLEAHLYRVDQPDILYRQVRLWSPALVNSSITEGQ
jgi:hypothetical protein